MTNIKCLITAGCSFSQVPNADVTWPVHLNDIVKPETVLYLGQGAAGNGIISRKAIYNTSEMLKQYKPEEILVGIMWSGFDRGDVYSTKSLDANYIDNGPERLEYCNPVKVADKLEYYITNPHWSDNLTKSYKEFMVIEDRIMATLEHILRVQWFLKLNKVPYFMVQYDHDCFDVYPYKTEVIKKSADLSFLWNQIDWKHWLPIENCYSWAKHESGFGFARPPDPHPSTEQHKAMVERIVLPFLVDKKILNAIL